MSEVDTVVLSLCQEFWQWRLTESPELATFCGFHQNDDKWDDISAETYKQRDTYVQNLLKRVKSVNITKCSPDVLISHSLLTNCLETYMIGSQFKSQYFPINYMEGILIEANMQISYMKFSSDDDFEKYISRLKKLPSRIDQVAAMLKSGVQEKLVMYSCSIANLPKQIDAILSTEVDQLDLLEPLSKDCKNVTPDLMAKNKVCAKDIIMSEVFPALTKLRDYIKQEYMQKTRPSPGINTLSNGTAWYQQCLNYHLTCNMTPQEIHQRGLDEVSRIRSQILKIAAKDGLGTTLSEVNETITKKNENFFKTQEEALDYVKNLCFERIRPKLSKLFKNIPDLPMTIKQTPEHSKDGPMGFYYSGLPDKSRDGVFYINTHNLKDLYPEKLPALCLHEGEPGHHLQGVHALCAPGLPDFRRYCEDMKYYMCPHAFPIFTAYVEGWGLYAESLGEELAIYEDSFEWLGRYSMEIFRAARLVVDTGLHAFGWSREQATKYMIENTLETKSEMKSEVDRYVTWPGQACAYKIGEIKIWELRKKAEKKLGDKFDIQEFHSRILSCGPVSLDVLSSIVDTFIKESKS